MFMEGLGLVIFDMDGLLFDTEPIYFKSMKKEIEKLGYEFSFDTYKLLVGIPDLESDEILQEKYGKEFSIQHILEAYHAGFKEIIKNEGLMIKPGAEKLLNFLDEKGIKKCIASSSNLEIIKNFLAITGLTNRFDFYVSGEEVERGKPHPDIFLEACRRANVEPNEALVIEDSLNGLKAAVSAKIKCIVIPDLIDPTEEMHKNAFKIVPDLEKVIGVLK
jgi:HAD superfamily hydrolase (TIGR01509 family)